MSIFRSTAIKWEGEEYKFTPSMSLLREIEGQNISIMRVAYEVAHGKPQTSHMAWILYNVLLAAGVRGVTEEGLFAELSVGDQAAVMQLYRDVMEAITPRAGKKPEAPSD